MPMKMTQPRTHLSFRKGSPVRTPIAASALAIALGAGLCLGQQVGRDLSADGTWSIIEAPELDTPAGELHLARQALAQQRYSDARRSMDAWIKAHTGDPLEPEAYLIRADALFLSKDYYKSLYDFEYI